MWRSNILNSTPVAKNATAPALSHAKTPQAETIINPKKLSYERNLETCGMCHSRGVSKPNGSFGYPWNDKDNIPYVVGEPLDTYYQFKPGEWGGMQAHAKSHHQQWHDLLRSKHYTAKVTCASCHDPHGSENPYQTIKQDKNNDLCLTCHGKRFANPDAVRKHTRHPYAPETTGASRCSSCHMVKTATPPKRETFILTTLKSYEPAVSLENFKKDPRGWPPTPATAVTRTGQRPKRVIRRV